MRVHFRTVAKMSATNGNLMSLEAIFTWLKKKIERRARKESRHKGNKKSDERTTQSV